MNNFTAVGQLGQPWCDPHISIESQGVRQLGAEERTLQAVMVAP